MQPQLLRAVLDLSLVSQISLKLNNDPDLLVSLGNVLSVEHEQSTPDGIKQLAVCIAAPQQLT